MLDFLVLGLVPGTNFQINFDMLTDMLVAVAVVIVTPRILRALEAKHLSV